MSDENGLAEESIVENTERSGFLTPTKASYSAEEGNETIVLKAKNNQDSSLSASDAQPRLTSAESIDGIVTLSSAESLSKKSSPSTKCPTPRRRSKLTQEEIEEREKSRLEKKKQKEEQAEKRRLEREALAKQREEKRLAEEEMRKRREEEKERKRREMKTREEEKEKRRLEEQKEEEIAREKKRREAEKFKSFFVKVDEPPSSDNTQNPFFAKRGMRLAPIHVRAILTEQEHNAFLRTDNFQKDQSDYLSQQKMRKAQNTKKDVAPEVVPVDESGVPLKVKLLQFTENYRPPYYGTWRRRSNTVTGRRPFKKDTILKYDYDSDEEWEDEPSDAEECKSDDEDELEKDDEDEEDNDGFFVEHGYLSPDEGSDENSENRSVNDAGQRLNSQTDEETKKDTDTTADEKRKHRLAQRAEEWKKSQKQKEERFKKRTRPSPTIFGPIWTDDKELPPEFAALRNQMRVVVIPYEKLDPSSSAALMDCTL